MPEQIPADPPTPPGAPERRDELADAKYRAGCRLIRKFGVGKAGWNAFAAYDALDEVIAVARAEAEANLTHLRTRVQELEQQKQVDPLSVPMVAGLLMKLKQECEAQHARAEAAESLPLNRPARD